MNTKVLLLPLIAGALLVHHSHSAPISIINPDFENGSTGWTTSTSDNGNYWSFVQYDFRNGSYQFNSRVARFLTANNHISGRLSQTLDATLEPSTTYTLSFEPVNGSGTWAIPQTFTAIFYAGSTSMAWDSSLTPTVSTSQNNLWTYELTTSAFEPLVGENIKIEILVGTGLFPNGVFSQSIYLDNFVLESVPEPSTYALLALGAIGAIWFRLRRKKA